jgi:hypothetical protein
MKSICCKIDRRDGVLYGRLVGNIVYWLKESNDKVSYEYHCELVNNDGVAAHKSYCHGSTEREWFSAFGRMVESSGYFIGEES